MSRSRALMSLVLGTLCGSALALGDGKLHMYFVDVGQGDATLIIGPQGTSVLVDGGPSNTPTPIVEAMNDAIAAGLTDNTLDYVVCSHFHADHLAALETFAQQFPGGIIAAYDRGGARSITAFTQYDDYFGNGGLNKRRNAATFSIGTNCTMNYVGKANAGESDENNNGVIYVLEFGAFRCSLGGDLGDSYEISFADQIGDVDHYKANHHGSGTSSQQAFLDVARPQTHTFSYGTGNSYGHPHSEAVTRLQAVGSARYDTNDHYAGAPYVKLVTNGVSTYTVNGATYSLPNATGGNPPAAPSALTAAAVSGSQINLAWTDNSSDEDNFVVARATRNGGPYSDVATLAANATSYADPGLASGTTYYYVVRATNAGGASADSNQASASTPSAPASVLVINEAVPAPGSGSEWVEIYNAGTTTVDLAGWQLDDLTGGGSAPVALSGSIAPGAFYVYNYSSAVLNNAGDDINLIDPSGATVDSTTYGSAPSDSSWARSTDGTGAFAWDSTPSKGATNGSAAPPPTAPAAPSNLSASAAKRSIKLSWTDNANNESNFVVEVSTNGTSWSTAATLAANTTAWTHSGLGSGQTRTYRVKATNSSGSSSYSNTATATSR